MTAQQSFWNQFMAWSLGLGFVLMLLITVSAICMISSRTGQQIIRDWHEERIARKRIRLRAELTRKGVDPDYIKQLEKEAKR